ncbi:MAG TPA: cytochrome C, partial [Candidatus Competibacteraceae bacterium]|nr:cytochrome C [Candidatus Competibacteraceae bacterium]
HFGQNASLDEESVRRISEFLVRHSADQGRAGAGGEPPLRITETAWFRREHDEIALATFQRLAIGGPGNCAACHQGAERGRFDEHSVRIPR